MLIHKFLLTKIVSSLTVFFNYLDKLMNNT